MRTTLITLALTATLVAWAMGFAAEIWEKSADPMWLPTLKQAHFMRQLNREISKEDDNFDLIE